MHPTLTDYDDAIRFARGLGGPWRTALDLVQLIAKRRGRPIHVSALDLTGTGITGTVLCGPEHDTIVHATGLPPFFTEHVIFHEIGHLVRGHLDGLPPHPQGAFTSHHDLLPPAEEREAELVATALAQVGREHDRSPRHLRADDGLVATLAPRLLAR